MEREYVRQVLVFEDHFKVFRKTLDRDALGKTPTGQLDKAEALMKKYFKQKGRENNE